MFRAGAHCACEAACQAATPVIPEPSQQLWQLLPLLNELVRRSLLGSHYADTPQRFIHPPPPLYPFCTPPLPPSTTECTYTCGSQQ